MKVHIRGKRVLGRVKRPLKRTINAKQRYIKSLHSDLYLESLLALRCAEYIGQSLTYKTRRSMTERDMRTHLRNVAKLCDEIRHQQLALMWLERDYAARR